MITLTDPTQFWSWTQQAVPYPKEWQWPVADLKGAAACWTDAQVFKQPTANDFILRKSRSPKLTNSWRYKAREN